MLVNSGPRQPELAGGLRDIAVFCSGSDAVSVAGFRMRGEFFWVRMQESSIIRTVAVRAGELWFEDRDLLKEDLCVQSAAS